MNLTIIQPPRTVPVQADRPPKENIPQTRGQREWIRTELRRYLQEIKAVPPLSVGQLRELSEQFVAKHKLDAIYTDYVAVVLNSEVWRDQVAAVPFERRLLLLPKCMRIESKCPAPFDEFGLLCKQCGLCSIQDLQEEAERLGYAVLVAEGSALVMAIIETGKIEAIVGVSCISVLEKAFPYMESAAIPGVAIPLLQDDCKDVTVDLDWIWEVIHLHSDDQTRRLDLDQLRESVGQWFEPANLAEVMGVPDDQTQSLAQGQLAQAGKRWRPFLTLCAWRALQTDMEAVPDINLQKLAIAVECFHKASLVHDDIEDDDATRYGEETLHVSQGLPVALNVGDYLLGEGYRLISECGVDPAVALALTQVAVAGHRTLCLGQGAELTWTRQPRPLSSTEVLEIFRKKTSPAFEVALQLGAIYAGADAETRQLISRFSESLGIAYQIRDDLDDLFGDDVSGTNSGDVKDPDDLGAMRPSLPLAVLMERVKAQPEHRALVANLWDRTATVEQLNEVRGLLEQYEVVQRCRVMQESYKEDAIRCLDSMQNASLKGLLRRVVSKIFVVEIAGWCHEFESRNAASGATSSASVG